MMNRIEIIEGDITKMNTDAIVNAANNTLLGGGGVDGAIHWAGGPIILEQCKEIGGCPTGEAKITTGGNLNANYVIHTVGPIYKDGKHNEEIFLANAYRNSLKLAEKYDIKTIAFPFISAGVYGYPKEDAAKIALETIGDELNNTNIEKVYIVLFGEENYKIFKNMEKILSK